MASFPQPIVQTGFDGMNVGIDASMRSWD